MLAPEDGRVGTPPGFPVRSSHPETWPCLPHAQEETQGDETILDLCGRSLMGHKFSGSLSFLPCEPSPGLAPPWPPLRLKLPGYSAGFSKTTPFIPPGRTAVPGIGKRGPLLICAGRKVTAGDACVLEAVSGASEAVALGSEILLGPPGPEGSPIRHQLLLADPLRLCTLQASLTTTPIPNVVSGHTPFPCLLPSSLTSCFSVHCPAGSGPLGTPLFPHCPILR